MPLISVLVHPATGLPSYYLIQELAVSLKTVLHRISETLTKLLDACEERLRDPDQPGAYTLARRADSIGVVYFEKDPITGKPIQKKASLQQLLTRTGIAVDSFHDLSQPPAVLMLQIDLQRFAASRIAVRFHGFP